MSKVWKHFRTITYHKYLVARGCFGVGLYKQGLLHDLSKYSPSEFWVGVKYFQGDRSPNNAEREDIGYSSAWLHHKGRNKHHYEYWIDYNSRAKAEDIMIPVPMPKKYIAEMVMDRIAASKVYMGNDYTDASPLQYYYRGTDKAPIHEETRRILLDILTMLAEKGEKETFRYVRKTLLK
ncbi:MAG: catalase [Lachnospiraceae bacterium]|nr:catalase [Lachnospiraceae bacterium]